MFRDARLRCMLLMALCYAPASVAQQPRPATPPTGSRIVLDVVVTPKSGPPVADLRQPDFTLLDNKSPQTITSFKAVTGREAPIEGVLVIDAVNASAQTVAYERAQIQKFLAAEGGHLAYPFTLAVVTDTGIQILGNMSSDGNALSAILDRDDIGIRSIGRSTGYYGAAERLQLSLEALTQLVAKEAPRAGRKVVLWVSPGWPLLSGPSTELGAKQQQQIFDNIVSISTQLLQARVTLYSVDPLGASESVGRTSYYKEFLKGVTKPNQVTVGNLGLQVLAIQSGGIAFSSTNDITKLLQDCLADSAPYYEISFDAPPAEHPDEYHQLEIKIARPGLTARTRQGYYAQPLQH